MSQKLALICLLSFSCCFAMDQSSSSGNELEKIDSLKDLPGDVEAQSSSCSSSTLLENLGVNKKTIAGRFLRKRIAEKKSTRSSIEGLNDSDKLSLVVQALEDCGNHHSKRKKQVTCCAALCACCGTVLVALITALGPTMAHLLTKAACD